MLLNHPYRTAPDLCGKLVRRLARPAPSSSGAGASGKPGAVQYFHIDIAEVQTAEGKLYLFVAIDRTSKFAYVELHRRAAKLIAAAFLRQLIAAVPYAIHIERRTTKVKHPWSLEGQETLQWSVSPTNGQVERMNRTIKEATGKRFHYDDHAQLRNHMANFISAYNFGRRLKTLKGLTPYEYICKIWTTEPERFTLNPIHQMPGPNN
jgi:transposase-like protein